MPTPGTGTTKATFVVDVGLAVNPRGLEAQMIGGTMDGIANALTYTLDLDRGMFAEDSWEHAYYTRHGTFRSTCSSSSCRPRANPAAPVSWVHRIDGGHGLATPARPGPCPPTSRSTTTSHFPTRSCREAPCPSRPPTV